MGESAECSLPFWSAGKRKKEDEEGRREGNGAAQR